MALVGSANIVIRAITTQLQSDIRSAFANVSRDLRDVGKNAGKQFSDGFHRNSRALQNKTMFNRMGLIARQAGDRAGALFGRAFGDGSNQGIRNGGRRLVTQFNQIGAKSGKAFAGAFNRGGGSKTFLSMALRISALVPILAMLVGGISSLVSGLGAVAAAASSASQSLIVIPGLLAAIVQGGIVMLASFQGVGDAISAGFEVAKEAGTRTAKAEQDAANAIKDAARGVRNAKEALADAYRNAAEATENALERIEDAEDSLADAQKNAKRAQEDLTKARIEARERLIDLEFSVRSGALAERRAALELADARFELNAASQLPADNRLRVEAQLAYEEARLNMEMITEQNGDLRKEQEETKKKGIEGSDEVVSAQENLRDAQDAVKDSAENLREAVEDLAKVNGDNARSIRNAKEALDEANEAAKGAAAGTSAAVTAADNYQKALNNLSPAARKFVEYIVSMREGLRSIRDAGAEQLFPRLQRAIENLVANGPSMTNMFRTTGAAVGDAMIRISKSLTTGPFKESFGNVVETNNRTIRRLGSAVGDLTVIMFTLLDAASPLIDRFTLWFKNWALGTRQTLQLKNATGELTGTFNTAGDRMVVIVDILKNLVEGFYDLGSVADDQGMRILYAFRDATEAFANFTDKAENRERLETFFENVTNNFLKISRLIRVVGGAFFRLGENQSIGKLATAMEPVVLELEKLFDTMLTENSEALITFIESLVKAFEGLAQTGALNAFLGVLTSFTDALAWLLNSPAGGAVGWFLKFSAAMLAVSIISAFPGVKLLIGLLSKVVLWMGKAIGRFILFGAAQKAAAAAMFVFNTAMRVLTVTMRVLGISMAASIGIWVVAIAAVIGIFVLLYKKVGWFRTAVQAVFKGIVGAFNWLLDIGKKLWNDWFGNSVFPDIVDGLKWFGEMAAKVFNGFVDVVKWVIDKVKKYWAFLLPIILGPFGLIIVLVAKNFDTVKKIVKAAMEGIKATIEFVWPIIKKIFDLWWKGVQTLAKVYVWLWKNVLVPVFNGIVTVVKFAVNLVIGYIKLWVNIFQNVIAPVVRWLYNNVIKPVFEGIAAVIKVAWIIIRAVFRAIVRIIRDVVIPYYRMLWNVVKTVFQFIAEKIRWAWGNVIRPVFRAIWGFISDRLIPGFKKIWNTVRDVFNSVKDKISSVWNDFVKPVFQGIRNFIIDKLLTAFTRFKTGVTSMWDKLKEAAKAPVAFVVNTIYNSGIRKLINAIPGIPGELKEIKGFASGGILPGYTPGRDVHSFYSPTAGRLNLSGGEAIMRPEWTAAVGPGFVNDMNKAARSGGVQGIRKALGEQGFAKGGIYWPLPGGTPSTYPGHDGVDLNAPNDLGKPYFSATSGKVTTTGYARGYGNAVFVQSPFGELVYGHSLDGSIAVRPNQYVNAGQMLARVGNTGRSSGPHLHFGFPGGTYERALGLLNGAPQVPFSEIKAAGSSEGSGADKWWDAVKSAKKSVTNITSGLGSMAKKAETSDWWKMMRQAAKSAAHSAVQAANDAIPNSIKVPGPAPDIPFPDNPIPNPFDQGGLARGEGTLFKATPAPERVLSPRQTEAFEQLVKILDRNDANVGSRGGDIKLDVHVPHSASAADVVNGIAYELRRLDRGGKYR